MKILNAFSRRVDTSCRRGASQLTTPNSQLSAARNAASKLSARSAAPDSQLYERKGRLAAFTLVEMLAVIGVLAILMGLLFPAVQKARQRALEVADKDMVTQVAAAWTVLAQENKRLPSADLISESLRNSGGLDDETPFDMEPGPCCVLNWWEAVRPSAKGDKKAFFETRETRPKYATTGGSVKKGDPIDKNDMKEGANSMYYPPDIRFERTADQKAIGIFPTWVERAIKRGLSSEELEGNIESEGEESSEETAKTAKSVFEDDPNCKDHGLVKVQLDFDGDGKIKVSGDYTESGNDEVVYATAVAFVFSEDGTRIVRSW